MKRVIFLLAILGLSQGASIVQPKNLNDDLQEFIDLIPTQEILNILMSNLDDDELISVMLYLFSDAFHDLIRDIENLPSHPIIVFYLEYAGIPFTHWINYLKALIGFQRSSVKSVQRGINDIIQEIISILPLDEMKSLYEYKLLTSIHFADMVKQLQSEDFISFVNDVASTAEVQRLAQALRDYGVDIDGFIQLVKEFFGFN